MFAIVNVDTREVQKLLIDRPRQGDHELPLLSVYVTAAEGETLSLPYSTWEPDIDDPNSTHLVYHSGTILTPAILQTAITRQDEIKAQIQAILAFAQGLNGRTFDSLNTTELKGLLQLLLARNGMIDINGNIDLSDFTPDTIFYTSGR